MKSIKDTLLIVKDAIDRYSIETRTKAYAALIGGHAAVFFGAERTTLDVDICFHAVEKQPGISFFRFLQKHLPPRYAVRIIEATKDPSDPLRHDLIIIDDTEKEYPHIDILLARYQWEILGLEQADFIQGLDFAVMPAPYLIAMKLMAGGRKDELDILDLLRDLPEQDLATIKDLAKRIGKDRALQSLLNERSRS